MKKYVFAIILFLFILIQKNNCAIVPELDYKYFGSTSNFLVSLRLLPDYCLSFFGYLDDLTAVKLSVGKRFGKANNSMIYDLGILSYQSFFKIPILRDNNYDSTIFKLGDKNYLQDEYSTFLTFSYQALAFTNSGLYNKDFNWSSIGIDLLYKNFKNNHFYTKLSAVLSANTIGNNRYFFGNIDSINRNEFCLNTKISSMSKWLFQNNSTLRFEIYYRNIYNLLNQKEISSALGYDYILGHGLIVNSQIGYIIYGANKKWNRVGSLNLGISYRK